MRKKKVSNKIKGDKPKLVVTKKIKKPVDPKEPKPKVTKPVVSKAPKKTIIAAKFNFKV